MNSYQMSGTCGTLTEGVDACIYNARGGGDCFYFAVSKQLLGSYNAGDDGNPAVKDLMKHVNAAGNRSDHIVTLLRKAVSQEVLANLANVADYVRLMGGYDTPVREFDELDTSFGKALLYVASKYTGIQTPMDKLCQSHAIELAEAFAQAVLVRGNWANALDVLIMNDIIGRYGIHLMVYNCDTVLDMKLTKLMKHTCDPEGVESIAILCRINENHYRYVTINDRHIVDRDVLCSYLKLGEGLLTGGRKRAFKHRLGKLLSKARTKA